MPPLGSISRTFVAVAIGQAISTPAQADTITVDTSSGSYGGDINSPCSIRDAISTVVDDNNSVGCGSRGSAPFIINFDASLYGSTITPGDLLDLGGDLSIVGPGAGSLTISGSALGSGLIAVSGNDISISGLTISNHTSVSGDVAIGMGGGTLSLADCEISHNYSNGSGGAAIAVFGGHLSMDSCVVSHNSVKYQGGAIYINPSTHANLANSTVTENWAGTHGGGIAARPGSTLILDNSRISLNSAVETGGGVYAVNATVEVLNNSTVSMNQAYTGGGVLAQYSDGPPNKNTASVLISSSEISDNTAQGTGADGRGGGYVSRDSSSQNIKRVCQS